MFLNDFFHFFKNICYNKIYLYNKKAKNNFGGEGGVRTLAPLLRPNSLANCPLHHLGTSPYINKKMAEEVGFEPTVPFDITSFQDWLLKPLGHLSRLHKIYHPEGKLSRALTQGRD